VVLTPLPSEILFAAGSMLSVISAQVANTFANLVGVTSTLTTQFGNPVITLTRPDQTVMAFSIDIACSGIYSLIGFVVFATFIAYIIRVQEKKLPYYLWGFH
jgi:hypothetical protein